jgi:hypothetical protein
MCLQNSDEDANVITHSLAISKGKALVKAMGHMSLIKYSATQWHSRLACTCVL